MEIVVNSILNLLAEHRYIFAFLGALLEGAYSLILVGVLLKFGYFNFWGLIIVLGIGYFLNGLAFYLAGRFGGHKILEKYGKKFRATKNLLEKLEEYFKKHSVKTLFITRITYGLSIPALIIAGAFKIKWKKFIIVTLIATFIWIAITLSIGYVFGVSYEAVGSIAKKIARGFAIALFIIIIAISVFIVVWIRKKFKLRLVKKIENNHFNFLKKLSNTVKNLTNGFRDLK